MLFYHYSYRKAIVREQPKHFRLLQYYQIDCHDYLLNWRCLRGSTVVGGIWSAVNVTIFSECQVLIDSPSRQCFSVAVEIANLIPASILLDNLPRIGLFIIKL